MKFPATAIRLCRIGICVSLFAVASLARSAEPPALKEVFQNHFKIGVAVDRSIVTGRPSFRRTEDQVLKDIELVTTHFNQVTAENDMKWQLIHPRPGEEGYDFGPADALVEFGEKHGKEVVGHTLVWHSQTPNWVFSGTGDSSRATREELLERMRNHIHTVVGRYRGKVRMWDVVNEAIADGGGTNVLRQSPWLEIIGPDFIAKAFQFAHEADPQAVLRYNDYGLENPNKRQKLITLIQSLRDEGVPVHAIGSQAHLNVSITFEAMDAALTEMASLGLPIHITELDINSARSGQRGTGADVASNSSTTQGGLVDEADQRLADAYRNVFRAFLKHRDSIELVTFWGVNDAVSWRARGKPLLFDEQNLPKPAFHAVIRVAQEIAAP